MDDIHDLAQRGDLQGVQALLKKNALLVLSKDAQGKTALHIAARDGHHEVAALLLASSADANERDEYGGTPLHWAALVGRREVVQLLIANRAAVNARARDNTTPMHAAALKGHKDVVQLLLAAGADPKATDCKGRTPLNFATANQHQDVEEQLRADEASRPPASSRRPRFIPPLPAAPPHSAPERNPAAVAAPDSSSLTPLERWKSSGDPEAWIRAHLSGWNHHDWLALLDSLRRSPYWPMEEASIGRHLETLRDQLHSK